MTMQSVENAKAILQSLARQWGSDHRRMENVPLLAGNGRISASVLFSSIDLPSFDNSAMDGVAVRSCHAQQDAVLTITGETRAGEPSTVLPEGATAIRIMTGASIPYGADAVVAKEEVIEDNGHIRFIHSVHAGQHIRRRGEDIAAGSIVLSSGTRLNERHIAFLAACGISTLSVVKTPHITVIATGHELLPPGQPLTPGKIFDSNSFFLRSALTRLHTPAHHTATIGDDRTATEATLRKSLEESDLILITGGVSVGDHDYTRPVLKTLGIEEQFWKVAQKPGKPLYAGTAKEKIVIGLPGNPYAVAMCFYVYVRPLILSMMGASEPELPRYCHRLTQAIDKDANRTCYLKGTRSIQRGDTWVTALSGQGSHQLRTLPDADCLIELPAGTSHFSEGDGVSVIEIR